VAAVAAGSEDAFVQLFRRYAAAACGLAHRVLGDAALAEEVLQEVFLSVWRRAGSYDPARGTVHSWLLTQVHHRAVDAVRRRQAARRRELTPLPEPVEDVDRVVEEDWLAVRRAQVRAALARLSAEHRQVIELAYYGGLTQAEIAGRTGLPLGTVKSRTLAAMHRLRRMLVSGEGAEP
jgi:RNA polymerase sigma factor (sigma-70 family)